jgi:hypothetical protein
MLDTHIFHIELSPLPLNPKTKKNSVKGERVFVSKRDNSASRTSQSEKKCFLRNESKISSDYVMKHSLSCLILSH